MSKLLITYVTGGYPTIAGSLDLARACVNGGADRIEIGIPFSDPMADGPVIQETSRIGLENGFTLDDAFRMAAKLRPTSTLFMSYLNPLLAAGLDRFFARVKREKISGVVVPDLPPEEADGRRVIFLCSPTCGPERIRLIDRRSHDFIYLVSLRGVTGARAALPADLGSFIRRVRRLSDKTLCVGFGISTPAQAAQVAKLADGVIVGSAILRIAASSGPKGVERFVKSLRRALN